MNKNHTKKYLQKFVDAVALCEEKERRHAKKFRDATTDIKKWEQLKLEQLAAVRKLEEMKKTHEEAIAALKEYKSKQEIEIIRKRQKYKTLTKMYAAQENCLNENKFMIHGADREIAYKKSLNLNSIKVATSLYLGETNPPDLEAGFFSNEMDCSLIPFEIDKNQHSSKEIKDQVFELMGKNSPYSEKWAEIFQG